MRKAHVLGLGVALCLLGAEARAYSAGITGHSGKTGVTCTQCHISDGAPNPTVTLAGPSTLAPGQRGVFTFRVTGGPAIRGGVNISATAGTLEAGAGTVAAAGDLRQAATLAFQSGEATVTFALNAPAQPGTLQLYAAGVSANGNATTTGDGVATTVLDVRVEAAPGPGTPGPVTPVPVTPPPGARPAPATAGGVTTVPGTPSVAKPASASVVPGTPESIVLSVLGADDNGETGLTYIWELVRGPAPVRLERNGNNAARSTRATLQAAGGYRFRVVIRDGQGWQTESFAEATVTPRLQSLSIVPPVAGVETGGTRRFRTLSVDQYGNLLDTEPQVTWAVAAGGTVAADGTFTAGQEPSGPLQLTATANGVRAQARLLVTGGTPPKLTLSPVPNDGLVSAATTDLDLAAEDEGGAGALEVEWMQIAGPAGGATFAAPTPERPASTKVTLARPGTYRLLANVSNASLLTSSVEVELRTQSSLTVSPGQLTMGAGQTAKLSAFVEDPILENGALSAVVRWEADPGLTVDPDGHVTVGANTADGTYRVIASFYGSSVTIPIQVQGAPVNGLPTGGTPVGGQNPAPDKTENEDGANGNGGNETGGGDAQDDENETAAPEPLQGSPVTSTSLGCSAAASGSTETLFGAALLALILTGLSRRASAARAKEHTMHRGMHRGMSRRLRAVWGIALLLATACEPDTTGVNDGGTESGETTVVQELPGATRLLPASDIRRQNMDGLPDDTALFRNLDDGPSQVASDEAGSYVRGQRNTTSASFTVGYAGAPEGQVTGAELHFRVRGSRGGSVRVRLFDGNDLIGEGPRRSVDEGEYTTFIETFVGLEVSSGNNLRTELEFRHPNDVSRMEATQLMLDITTQSTCSPQQVSALSFLEQSNGRGPVERNRSNGGSGAGDGRQIRIEGEPYSTGLGVRADSRILLALNGNWETFNTDIGIDDEVGNNGSVVFEIRADGEVLFTSGARTGSQRAQSVEVSVVGKQALELIVRAEGDDSGDSAVWANARLVPTASCGGRLYTYLTRDGAGSLEEAEAYYRSIGAREDDTLDEWIRDNIGSDQRVEAYFRNAIDLGFWREMVCSENMGRGFGGCMVRNWENEEDKDNGGVDLGTVAMNVSPQGFTRFYVFAPGGRLSPLAILDSEGEKYVPRLCTNCHGGQYDGVGANPDLGSVFREFEPSLLERRTGIGGQTAENEWFRLNEVMKKANAALRTEAEGGKTLKTAKDSMLAYLEAIYSQKSPPVSIDVRSEGHLPPSWREGGNPVFVEAKKRLWTQMVSPYCVACHRLTALDFTDYAKFAPMGAESPDGGTILERYINFSESDPKRTRLALMPQSELMSNLLLRDSNAQRAIADWLVQQVDPSAPQSRVDIVVSGPAITQGQSLRLYGDTAGLARFNLAQPGVPLVQVTPGRFEASASLPQGAQVRLKLALFEDGKFIRWANETAQVVRVPSTTRGTAQLTFR